jgi:hypothetical protein
VSDAPLPDVLVITARHEESVAADRAELLVTVHGSSLVTGRAALKKAKEVSALVEELERCGVGSQEIHLVSVQAADGRRGQHPVPGGGLRPARCPVRA